MEADVLDRVFGDAVDELALLPVHGASAAVGRPLVARDVPGHVLERVVAELQRAVGEARVGQPALVPGDVPHAQPGGEWDGGQNEGRAHEHEDRLGCGAQPGQHRGSADHETRGQDEQGYVDAPPDSPAGMLVANQLEDALSLRKAGRECGHGRVSLPNRILCACGPVLFAGRAASPLPCGGCGRCVARRRPTDVSMPSILPVEWGIA